MSAADQPDCVSGAGENNFAVLDLDQVDARIALTAFLARGAGFLELDLSVHARQFDLPERRADRLRIGLARLRDCGGNSADAVITAEALGQAGERVTTFLPFLDEGLRHRRIG